MDHPVTVYIHMSRCCDPDPTTVATVELDNPTTANRDVAAALRQLADEWERGQADYTVSPDAMRWQPEEEGQ